MKLGRLKLLICLLVLGASGFALAQEAPETLPETPPQTTESSESQQQQQQQQQGDDSTQPTEGGTDPSDAVAAKTLTEEDKKRLEEEEARKQEANEKAMQQLREGITDTVKVTATRVETDLMKTPVAVTVIDQDTMDREGIRSVDQIAQMVPNMDIAVKNGQSTPMISLRGIRSTNETELGDPSVGVHLDGIYSPRMQGILAMMFDNERVEVLRGPQGTLFGRNSTVGSINIVTAKPDLEKFSGRILAQYANFNAAEVQGVINVPVTRTFGLRFSGRYHKRDSYIQGYWDPNQYDQRAIADIVQGAAVIGTGDDCTSEQCFTRTQHSNWWANDEVGPNAGMEIRELVPADESDFYMNAEEWGYRASAMWQPLSKKMSANFLFQHYRQESGGGIDLVNCEKLRGRPRYCRDANLDGQCDVAEDGVDELDIENFIINPDNPTDDCNDLFPEDDTYQAVVNTPGRFFLDIKYLRGQFNYDIKKNLRFVYNGGYETQDRESAVDMEASLNAWDQAMYFLPGTGSSSWMHEIQLQSQGNKRLNWIAGANLFHETTNTVGFFDNAISDKDYWDQPSRSTDAAALFAQGTYSFNRKFHLTLGYRYSDETKQDVGGRTYNCAATNTCATPPEVDPALDREQIDCTLNDPDNPALGYSCGVTAFSREMLNQTEQDFFADPTVYDDFAVNDNEASWSHHDWRIGLDYQHSDDTLLYTYLATGFKAGGIGDVINTQSFLPNPDYDPVNNPFVPPFIPGEELLVGTSFDPEEVTTLEMGLKQRFLRGKLNVRAAYFFSDYRDMQYAAVGTLGFTQSIGPIFDPDTGAFEGFGILNTPIIAYFTDNVPGAEIQGIELEFDATPWRGGRIVGYASWLDTEITEDWIVDWGYDPVSYFGLNFADVFENPDPVLQANLKGNSLAVSPPFKLHFTLDHAFFLKNMRSTLVPWITYHWEDASYLTIWNVDKHTDDLDFVIRDEDIRFTDDRRESWSMIHAGLRFFAPNGLSAELFAYNVTDEVVQWWGGAAEGVARGSFSMPFNYGFRVGYQW